MYNRYLAVAEHAAPEQAEPQTAFSGLGRTMNERL